MAQFSGRNLTMDSYGWEVCLLISAASGGYASHRNWAETQRGIWVLCHVQQSLFQQRSLGKQVRISRSVDELLGTLIIWSPVDHGGIGDMNREYESKTS